MKKFLSLSLLLLSAVVFAPSAEAKTNTSSNLTANSAAAPQINVQIGRGNRRNNRRAVRTYTRNVRQGRFLYRETYRDCLSSERDDQNSARQPCSHSSLLISIKI